MIIFWICVSLCALFCLMFGIPLGDAWSKHYLISIPDSTYMALYINVACAWTKNEMTKFTVVIQMGTWILDPFWRHFWECLPKRCIVAPNKRGREGGEVIVPKPAGTASTLRPVATKECWQDKDHNSILQQHKWGIVLIQTHIHTHICHYYNEAHIKYTRSNYACV